MARDAAMSCVAHTVIAKIIMPCCETRDIKPRDPDLDAAVNNLDESTEIDLDELQGKEVEAALEQEKATLLKRSSADDELKSYFYDCL